MEKIILLRVPPIPPFPDENVSSKIEETIQMLETEFPDRKIIKVPMELGVEFKDI